MKINAKEYKQYIQGHEIYYDEKSGQMLFCDTLEPISHTRPCKKCGKPPTPEGYDACLGKLEGIHSACCGHGVEKPYATKRGRKIGKLKKLYIEEQK